MFTCFYCCLYSSTWVKLWQEFLWYKILILANQWTGFYMITASVLKGLREACHEYYLKFKSVYSQGIFKISISLSYENSRNTVLNHKTMRFVIRLCFNVTHNAGIFESASYGSCHSTRSPWDKKTPFESSMAPRKTILYSKKNSVIRTVFSFWNRLC